MNKSFKIYYLLLATLIAFVLTKCVEDHVLPNFGKIFVSSIPPGAAIFLDDENTGKVTPDSLLELVSAEYLISLKLATYNDSTINVQLEDNQNVTLNIVLEEANPQGEITLTSQPSGAAVTINGEVTGNFTPATFSNLKQGNYEIQLTLNLYEPAIFTIILEKDEKVNRNTEMIIAGSSGGLFINSNPEGAQIFLDNNNTGKVTPDTLKPLNPGNYEIKLSLVDYKDTIITTSVSEGNITSENVNLKESNPQGEITLTSQPSGAAITINGEVTDEITPASFSNLERGNYEIQLTLDLYEPAIFTIILEKDEKVNRNTEMIIAGSSGGLFINSNPEGAQIFLDNNNTGKVTPDTLKPLNPGNYEIKLSLADYRDTTITTSVSEGNITSENVNLTLYEPRGSITLDSEPQGANIFLNGTDTELLTPNTIRKLEAGNYNIGLTLESYYDTTFTVGVVEDLNTNVPKVELVIIPYIINVSVFPENSGSVTGGGEYEPNQTVVLTATPNVGYNFFNWTENGNILSSSPTLNFTADSSRNIVANFQLKSYVISATTDPLNSGTISGTGIYNHGDFVEMSVSPNVNFVFVNWTENGNVLSTQTNFNFTAVSNRNLVANLYGIGNLFVGSDPIGANITLNNQFTGEQTPYEFLDITAGTYSVKLDLEDFADTTIITEVFPGETTDLGTIFLTDTTSAVEVNITYNINPVSQRINFFFVFNQDIRFNRVDVTNPEGTFFQWPFNNQLFPEGIPANFGLPEKIVGIWSFTCIGVKAGGRQTSFNVSGTVTVN